MTEHQDGDDLFAASEAAKAAPENAVPATAAVDDNNTGNLGATLRAAREAKGLSLLDCGHALHLPAQVLQRLEANDFGEADHFVFLRGVLKGYAAFLGLPADACTATLRAAAPAAQPALVSVARVSHTRWLLQRYRTAGTAAALTAMIVVPLIVLGLRGGLERPATEIVSLDRAPAVAKAPAASVKVPEPHIAVPTPSPDSAPFLASMTPFIAVGFGADQPAENVVPPATAATTGQHALTITATGDCWYEITAADGTKIESGMLHAGDSKTWHSDAMLRVTLGNAGAVSVTQDGQPFALDTVQHSNVAHFDVFGTAGATPAAEND